MAELIRLCYEQTDPLLQIINMLFFFFQPKILVFFLLLHENTDCGYSFEAPHRVLLMKHLIEALLVSTHNACFRGRIIEIFTYRCIPLIWSYDDPGLCYEHMQLVFQLNPL